MAVVNLLLKYDADFFIKRIAVKSSGTGVFVSKCGVECNNPADVGAMGHRVTHSTRHIPRTSSVIVLVLATCSSSMQTRRLSLCRTPSSRIAFSVTAINKTITRIYLNINTTQNLDPNTVLCYLHKCRRMHCPDSIPVYDEHRIRQTSTLI